MERKEAEKALLNMAGIPDERIILMSKFSPVPYAERLLANCKFLFDKYKRFWRFSLEEGIWKEDAEQFIRGELRSQLLGEEQQKNNYCQEVVSYIRDLSYKPDFNPELKDTIIPFKNVLYDIETEQFIDFSADYFVTHKLPVEIDSSITSCDVIDTFLKEVVGEEYATILYELAAYCFYRSQPYQKLFFLTGGGNNGKSTYLELLRALLGEDNVSSVSPHDICGGNRFALGGMWNKLANISSDISYEILKEVNKIKEITGGDTVSIERKFQPSFPTKLYAKQIFSTNQLPIVNDKTIAWYRRPYLIEFIKYIDKPDKELLKKLTSKNQLSGFAWQCLKHLKNIRDNNFTFTYDIDVNKLAKMYEELSNPLSKFINENCHVDEGDQEAYIWKFEFRERFEEWLKLNRFRIWNETELGVQMKIKFQDGQRWYRRFGMPDKHYRCWDGLKWKSQGSPTSHPFTISSLYIRGSNKGVLSALSLLPATISQNTQKLNEPLKKELNELI